jgi:nucleoid DNA-binding protein
MNAQLKIALDAIKPELAARYEAQIRRQYEVLLEKFGPTFKGAASAWGYTGNWQTVCPLLVNIVEDEARFVHSPKILSEKKLAKFSEQQAHFAVESWAAKIDGKLGELDSVSVNKFGNCAFVIFGSRNGKAIKIEQSVVLKYSNRGKLFNQFPAHIYVDGKFISEAKYKALFA